MSDSKIDVFMRIKNHFKSLIEKGAYLEGEPLPSVRNAALDLGVNPNTVQKAYQALENDGLIEILPKKGSYVKKYETSDQHLIDALKHILNEFSSRRQLVFFLPVILSWIK